MTIDDEVQVFRINIKLLSNPVAELKIRENDSHCRSIVLKTMDRSIVKQLKLYKNQANKIKRMENTEVDVNPVNKDVLKNT
jgi:hypothetical protein